MARIFDIAVAVFIFVPWGADAATVKVGIADNTVAQIALYTGKEKGYYAQEGITVELVLMSGAVANLALIGGNVDFTTVPTAGLTAAIQGAPLRVLFNTFNRPVWRLNVKPDIVDIKELKGRRIGTGGFGSATDILLRELLNKYGLEAGRDVVLLSLGSTSTRLNALITGSVDAAVLPVPFNFRAQEAGFRELISFVNQGLVLLTGTLMARNDNVQTNAALVERFLRATLKGFMYARDNRPSTIAILAHNINVKNDLAAKIYDSARPAMTEDGTVTEGLQKQVIEQIARLRGLKETPPVDKFFDFALLRKTAAALQAAAWKPGP